MEEVRQESVSPCCLLLGTPSVTPYRLILYALNDALMHSMESQGLNLHEVASAAEIVADVELCQSFLLNKQVCLTFRLLRCSARGCRLRKFAARALAVIKCRIATFC